MGNSRLCLKVKGTVQGVGFRPYVFGLATALGLKGYVANTADGVTIDVEGADVGGFVERLRRDAPPLSRIVSIDIFPLPPSGCEGFEIRKSSAGGNSPALTPVSPDVSVCEACLKELFDENDRRYLYPFINCTNCGPRYTITRGIPYDRENTTMSAFGMCPECKDEYKDPSNRRFHAEPVACPACGPTVKLISGGIVTAKNGEAVRETVELLSRGSIVAVKGLGGFHLACDAANDEAIKKLRERKRRNNRPFALMAPDLETIRKFCIVSEEEAALLESPERPIVLLKKRAGKGPSLPDEIAPGNKRLGFMLPYAPLHYLLFRGCRGALTTPVFVMTSGNLSEEPIQIEGREAIERLGGIADAFLDHDREIFMRTDDSVVKKTDRVYFVRRARGFVPAPIVLDEDSPDVLAVGADLKNTFTLVKGSRAIVSQHIGDMGNHETLRFFGETLNNLTAVYKIAPVAIAHDMHPGYQSTLWAKRQSGEGLPAHAVQHHHAHIASVMAEKNLKGKVIGVAFDGTGYGTDGALWGGEFLVADALDFSRTGHLRYVPLPGGEQAIREPWRMAVSYVLSAAGGDCPEYLNRIGFLDKYGEARVGEVLRISGIGELAPLSSGAGRLFDAVSAVLGICDRNTFEGEAAIALEAEAEDGIKEDYPLDIKYRGWPSPISHRGLSPISHRGLSPLEVDFSFAMLRIIEDISNGLGRGVIAARFHNTVIEAIARVVGKLSSVTGIREVILSGGVFQNDYILLRAADRLLKEGLSVHTNELVPSNDGGISLGQAYILRERLKAGWELP